MVGLDTQTRAQMRLVAEKFKVELVDNGTRLAVIDPTRKINGEDVEVVTFDLHEARNLDVFLKLLIGPALHAAGYNPDEIFGKEDTNAEDVA